MGDKVLGSANALRGLALASLIECRCAAGQFGR